MGIHLILLFFHRLQLKPSHLKLWLLFIALGTCLLMLVFFKRRPRNENYEKRIEAVYARPFHKHTSSDTSFDTANDEEKGWTSKLPPLQPAASHPLPIVPGDKFINPAIFTEVTEGKIQIINSSVHVYTVASLQQYKNSFSQENCIGEGTLGPVYKAELPDGKLLAVRKLNPTVSMGQTQEQFLQLVSSISKIQHANIVKLMGCCAEYSQRQQDVLLCSNPGSLVVYKYCSNGSLHDALHADDKLHNELSWNERIQVSLGAARALDYLHESC